MNNITRIKQLTPAILLICSCSLASQAATSDAATASINQSQAAGETLTARQQAIPLMAAFMASSQMEKLDKALNQGLDAGLTVNEAKEILVQLYAYTGFPRSLNALNVLMQVTQARKQRGIHDIQGKEPVKPVPAGDELRRTGTENQTRISGAPVQGPLFEFVPVINQFLQTHLFGDIFARDNLDWQSRELATVGALAATPGVEAQLLSHTRASLRVGLSRGQLQQLVKILRDNGEPQAAARAEQALLSAQASADKESK
ncbi:alkylhydroperoxidase/carboxymuconolactone decarboxylase family protein YurZ [Erwinia toletana]|uniref:Alkylhydroperoxidase/carboxymuconolactone decarboxylase family protein YurZ n=1 Tax=Winslowiella toletana TaxID=92490 RepID=A0ABS4PEP3_9GAMM|nr:carboxymuconolactone decarboxylase family protein [Winslowiella toletana]MBP2171106.1 alkylhydroperoxidase/carboxymuconolactone decarboxylase family protein YurZ [Winslowiella toletana]